MSTLTDTVPPDADTDEVMGDTVKRHGAASCATVTCVPLTSSVPLRDAGAALASTRYETVPLPCPLPAEVRAIQFTPLDASHVQSRVVVIVSEPLPPPAGAVAIELSTETEHFGVLGDVVEIVVARPHDPAAMAASAKSVERS